MHKLTSWAKAVAEAGISLPTHSVSILSAGGEEVWEDEDKTWPEGTTFDAVLVPPAAPVPSGRAAGDEDAAGPPGGRSL